MAPLLGGALAAGILAGAGMAEAVQPVPPCGDTTVGGITVTFVDVTPALLGSAEADVGAAWGDVDHDGDLDLYLVNSNAPKTLLRNDTASGNHWLHLDLLGTVSNRAAIGARVKVYAGGLMRMEEVPGASGYHSQNSLTAEFGLGASTIVDSIVIRWPSGIVSDTTGVAVDQKLLIVEPGPSVGVGEAPAPARGLAFAVSPNPAARGARIEGRLPAAGRARVTVIDLQGRFVRAVADEARPAGPCAWVWDGRDADGAPARAGVYVVRLALGSDAGRQTALRKIVVARWPRGSSGRADHAGRRMPPRRDRVTRRIGLRRGSRRDLLTVPPHVSPAATCRARARLRYTARPTRRP